VVPTLRIRGGERKYYIAKYRIGAKSGRASLGNASKVTLADAKVHAKKVFDQVAAKINPATQRTKAAAQASETFGKYIDRFLAVFKDEWAAKYYQDNVRALKIHFKALHPKSLADIERADVATELAETRRPNPGIASSNSIWSDLPAGGLKDLTLASVNLTGRPFEIGKHMGSIESAFHRFPVHNNQPTFEFMR
jgi:hypothetical protein